MWLEISEKSRRRSGEREDRNQNIEALKAMEKSLGFILTAEGRHSEVVYDLNTTFVSVWKIDNEGQERKQRNH